MVDKAVTPAELVAASCGPGGVEAAVEVCRRLLVRARELQTPQERRQQAELDRMIGHLDDKATLVEMTDQAFRAHVNHRAADQLTHILDLQGVPRFFSGLDRTMLRGFQTFGGYLPGVAVPLVKDKMRRETANVILPAEDHLLSEHLRERRAAGIRMNVNLLGEALIGESEARRRLNAYLDALQMPDVECISVKISTIYSQISPVARQHTVNLLADRLELLFRAAAREQFTRPDGTTSKFVYLDMEEYRDMYLTRDALKAALDRPGLENVRAGIALQAYIPDSFAVLRDLAAWSTERVARARQSCDPVQPGRQSCDPGRSSGPTCDPPRSAGPSCDPAQPLTVRVVKGANLEMERVEASIAGWPQATYQTKVETDANYKRMIRYALRDEFQHSLRLGVASHNLFDVSLALLWATQSGALAQGRVQFEMLEGMANHQRRALCEVVDDVLLYAPACKREDFIHAIGYLIRRLDENTGPENFLRHAFRLDPDGPEFAALADGFRRSAALAETVSDAPRRQQDRRQPPPQPPAADHWRAYVNEPDTDWSLPHHAQWAQAIVDKWKGRCDDAAPRIPLVIAGQARTDAPATHTSTDPSRPGTVVCRYTEASEQDVDAAVECAKADPSGWRTMPHAKRHEILRRAAQRMREHRNDLIGAAMADGGKTITEADPEVSEAIDFTEFYPLVANELFACQGVRARGRGVVAVVSPWNFPIAIPCGGVAAALAAGNTVILKPASDTVLPAWLICHCFWEAGVPPQALQMLPCRGSTGGRRLVTHPDVDVVILTGGTETAVQMLRSRPDMELVAETGGKNATIITALADRELAIKHVLHSAFSHSGQKCSATSLLLLEEEVYEDPHFRESLTDAVQSLTVGSAWDLQTRVGPLIRPPQGALLRELKELEHGERWLVMSEQVGANPCLYRPSIKWDVSPDSFTHLTELFGPVLGVMKFRRLEEAIEIVNRTGYGLTSGLESLDDREHQTWQSRIRAGNLYINRPTTGAIVLRQPFGGVAKSAWGSGIKAGGPNYLIPLMHFEELTPPSPPPTSPPSSTTPLAPPAPNSPATPEETLRRSLSLIEQIVAEATQPETIDAIARLSHRTPEQIHQRLRFVASDIAHWVSREFSGQHDTVRLVGQDNFRRYRPVEHLRMRLQEADAADDILIAVIAAAAVDCRPVISAAPGVQSDWIAILEKLTEDWAGRIEIIEESDEALAEEIRDDGVDRVRLPGGGPVSKEILDACREAFIPWLRSRAVASGRIEPLWYVTEQSLSIDYHRYGNLGRRAAGFPST